VGVEIDAAAKGDPEPKGDTRDGSVSDRQLN
jgi:hypothetical protein